MVIGRSDYLILHQPGHGWSVE